MKTNLDAIQIKAAQLVKDAAQCGVVVTIETRPRLPLAMGHHEMVVDVRPARERAPKREMIGGRSIRELAHLAGMNELKDCITSLDKLTDQPMAMLVLEKTNSEPRVTVWPCKEVDLPSIPANAFAVQFPLFLHKGTSRKPLTYEQKREIELKYDAHIHDDKTDFIVNEVEAAHGITEGNAS